MTDRWQAGQSLKPLWRELTAEKIRRYAEASGDFNPLHLDPTFAQATQFGGIVAHGMLLLGYVSDLMSRRFGPDWARGGRLKVRFKAPARPGERLEVWGTVRQVREAADAVRIVCDVGCRSDDGEEKVVGEATVQLPGAGRPSTGDG